AAHLAACRKTEILEGLDDLFRRALALYAHWIQQQVDVFETALQNRDHVGDHRAGRRGNQADALRKLGDRALARGVEQAFLGEALLELLEGQLQRAET